jgi:von Willebrand factor type A domain
MSQPSHTAARWLNFLYSAMFVALFAVVGWILLAACGIRTPLGIIEFGWCQASAVAGDLDIENQREGLLREQIVRLERALRHPDRCGPRVAITKPPATLPTKSLDKKLPACPAGKVAQLPKNTVIVVDTSNSMGGWLRSRAARLRKEPKTRRIEAAQSAIIQAVQRAPKTVQVGLVSFAGCRNEAKDHGIFSYSQRAALVREVQSLRLSGGTPLARAMSQTHAQLSRGVSSNAPVNMVVISDGRESCRGDPCDVARKLKNQMPGLVINVLEITRRPVIKCVAEITGGFHRLIGDRIDLEGVVREAVGYEGQGFCRPAIEK